MKFSIQNQKGAMFGLDARIAMAIFGAISVIAGGYVTLNTSTIRGGALSDELKQLTVSIEGIHSDLKDDLHSSLITNNDENAFIALYDASVLSAGTPQIRWLGPYVEFRSSTNSRYGDMRLTKLQDDRSTACVAGTICYIWISFGAVPTSIADKVNSDYDGAAEASPNSSGRVQQDVTGSNAKLWFRAVQGLQ